MARLGDHPNIVTVFDTGEDDPSSGSGQAPQPFMVSQYMAGGSVEDLIAQAEDHKLALEDVVRIGNEIAAGLEYAHSKGVVHRDLKPGNIWLTGTTGNEQLATRGDEASPLSPGERVRVRGTLGEAVQPPVAKIGDFGLAVALDRSRLTQAGMMLGTVAYMAPEQALGQPPEPRSDLYSLGCILYEMVTGRPPFVGDESVGIVTQHLNTPPVAPAWHRSDCPWGWRPSSCDCLRRTQVSGRRAPLL